MRAWIAALLTLAAGCSKGDGVVVLSVTASPALANVGTLHTTATVGTTTREFDVQAAAGGATVTLPPAITFAIVIPADLGATLSAHVEARDGAGRPLAAADGNAPVTAGQRSDVTLTLGSSPLDGGVDLAGADFAGVDFAGVDFATVVPDLAGADFTGVDFAAVDLAVPTDLASPALDLTTPTDMGGVTILPCVPACTGQQLCQLGLCVPCGQGGQPCCPYDQCQGNGCCINGTCLPSGQICFGGGPSCQGASQCGGGGGNTCGTPGHPCCQNTFCTAPFVMCSGAQCVPCGQPTQPCCPSSPPTCISPSICSDGTGICQ